MSDAVMIALIVCASLTIMGIVYIIKGGKK